MAQHITIKETGVVPQSPVSKVLGRMQTIREVLERAMKKGIDYGEVPGTAGNRFALFKAGAEKLLVTFNLRSDLEVEDLSQNDLVRYRVKVKILSPSGELLGVGVGECSSREEKYRWREAVCKEEWDETSEGKRRVKWKRGQYKTIKTLQVERDPFDVANTVLKMAKKRALVDAVLTVLAVSDIFTQDEDAIEEFMGNGNGNNGEETNLPSPDEPLSSSSAGTEKAGAGKEKETGKNGGNGDRGPSKAQINFIRGLLKDKGVPEDIANGIISELKTVKEASEVIDVIKKMAREDIIKYFGSGNKEKNKNGESAEEIEKEIEEEIF